MNAGRRERNRITRLNEQKESSQVRAKFGKVLSRWQFPVHCSFTLGPLIFGNSLMDVVKYMVHGVGLHRCTSLRDRFWRAGKGY